MWRTKFKKFGGDYIPDIIDYIDSFLESDPNITITVGCDSIQKRRKTVYAITIMLYNDIDKEGAHVVFFRESVSKIRDNQERLYKEAQYLYEIGTFLNEELNYQTNEISDIQRKKYKLHLLRCEGKYLNIESHREDNLLQNMILTPEDMVDYSKINLHVDFNPFEGKAGEKGIKNKSYFAYKSYVPWLRGMGFRVWAKPLGFASSAAADLLLKD